jgi:hypothetical protein
MFKKFLGAPKTISRHRVIVLALSFIFINTGVIFSDLEPGAPRNPGSALIIYNSQRSVTRDQRQFDHSIPAMLIFRAALDSNHRGMQFLQHNHPDLAGIDLGDLPFTGSEMITQGIPPIEWPLTMVDVLDVRHRQGGIDTDLRAWANNNLSGRNRQIFDELYEAGNPLSYWSQVYDLRYIQEFWDTGQPSNTPLSVITTTGPRSDLAYFRALLRDGGGLYIQAADSAFADRNISITTTINALTRNNVGRAWGNASGRIGTAPPSYPGGSESTTPSGNASTTFWFNNSRQSEHFATDFNNLDTLQRQFPMRWVRIGGVHRDSLQHAIPLVRVGETGRVVKMFWDRDGLEEDYQNGRLIVSYAITAFRDHEDGSGAHQSRQGWTRTSRTTLAMVQNLYDLMSGTQRYTLSKSFVPDERGIGDTGTVRIAIRNPNLYPFLINAITDELSSCLRFTRDIRHSFIDMEGNVTPTTASQTQNGRTLRWELTGNDGHIPLRSDWVIEFEYVVDNSDCGN